MYMRSLYFKQLAGNQLGQTGLLVTCVSHHMTDMQISNYPSDGLVYNDLRLGDDIDLPAGPWKLRLDV